MNENFNLENSKKQLLFTNQYKIRLYRDHQRRKGGVALFISGPCNSDLRLEINVRPWCCYAPQPDASTLKNCRARDDGLECTTQAREKKKAEGGGVLIRRRTQWRPVGSGTCECNKATAETKKACGSEWLRWRFSFFGRGEISRGCCRDFLFRNHVPLFHHAYTWQEKLILSLLSLTNFNVSYMASSIDITCISIQLVTWTDSTSHSKYPDIEKIQKDI